MGRLAIVTPGERQRSRPQREPGHPGPDVASATFAGGRAAASFWQPSGLSPQAGAHDEDVHLHDYHRDSRGQALRRHRPLAVLRRRHRGDGADALRRPGAASPRQDTQLARLRVRRQRRAGRREDRSLGASRRILLPWADPNAEEEASNCARQRSAFVAYDATIRETVLAAWER